MNNSQKIQNIEGQSRKDTQNPHFHPVRFHQKIAQHFSGEQKTGSDVSWTSKGEGHV
jgi:hypothetical protein